MAFYDASGNKLGDEDLKSLETTAPATAPIQSTEEPGWFEPGSKSEAAARGFSNAATLGTGKYWGGIVHGLTSGDDKKSWLENIKAGIRDELDANERSSNENPKSYGAGSVVGALPMAAVAAGAGLPTAMAGSATMSGMTTLADTGDTDAALKSAAIGAAIPAVFKGASVAAPAIGKALTGGGVAEHAIDKTAQQVAQLAKNGPSMNLVKGGNLIDPKTGATLTLKDANGLPYNAKPAALAEKIGEEGLDVLNQPQWAAVKDFIAKKNPSGMFGAVRTMGADAAKGAGAGAVVGGTFGMPGVGMAVGGAGGMAHSAKDYLANRVIQKTLSPAAQAGQGIIEKTMRAAGPVAANASQFSIITGMLNQRSPEARAALNPENPMNKD